MHLYHDLFSFDSVEADSSRVLARLPWVVVQEREQEIATVVVSQHLEYGAGFDRRGVFCHHVQ